MNNRTRNRLIGIISILLIIMIFFPYVVRENSFQPKSTISLTTPSDSQTQDIIIEAHPDSSAVPDLEDTEAAPIVADIEPEVVIPSANTANSSSLPVTVTPPVADNKVYNIQLVALKNKQKIEELVALLRLHNYDVYTDPQKPTSNQIIRLFVGPYSSKEQAELVILDLKNLTKLEGFIVSR